MFMMFSIIEGDDKVQDVGGDCQFHPCALQLALYIIFEDGHDQHHAFDDATADTRWSSETLRFQVF